MPIAGGARGRMRLNQGRTTKYIQPLSASARDRVRHRYRNTFLYSSLFLPQLVPWLYDPCNYSIVHTICRVSTISLCMHPSQPSLQAIPDALSSSRVYQQSSLPHLDAWCTCLLASNTSAWLIAKSTAKTLGYGTPRERRSSEATRLFRCALVRFPRSPCGSRPAFP